MTLESSKTLSGVGALLLFIAATLLLVSIFGALFIGLFGALALGIVGAIVLLVGLNGLADYYKERKIFNQPFYSIIIAVVGAVIAVVILASVTLANITPFLSQIYPGWNGDLSSLPNTAPDPNVLTSGNFDLSTIMPLLVGIGAFWIIIWITSIISTFLVRRSLVAIAEKSNMKLFSTAGLLMLLGGFLGLVAIGYFLILLGLLLAAAAFFQLQQSKPNAEVDPQYLAPPIT
jgi:uncharacterized membrane protein